MISSTKCEQSWCKISRHFNFEEAYWSDLRLDSTILEMMITPLSDAGHQRTEESLLHVQEWTTLATDPGRRTSEGLWGRVRHFVSQSPSQQAHGKVPMGLPGLLLLTLELLTRSTRNPFLISLFHVSLSVPRSSNNCKSNLNGSRPAFWQLPILTVLWWGTPSPFGVAIMIKCYVLLVFIMNYIPISSLWIEETLKT